MIAAPFVFLQINVKRGSRQSTIFSQGTIGDTPKPFNAMDMSCAIGNFIITMIDLDDAFDTSGQPTTPAQPSRQSK
jgi:hypothetical protein